MSSPVVPPSPTAAGGRRRRFLAGFGHSLSSLPMGAAGLAVVIAGWSVMAGVVITPLSVPVLMGFGWAVRGLARLEARLARTMLGVRGGPVAPPDARGRGFWRAGLVVLRDRRFWRGQAYLLLRFVVGLPVAVVQLSLAASALWCVALPVTYRWIPNGDWHGVQIGSWHIDRTTPALLGVPAGLALAGLTVGAIVGGARLWRALTRALLTEHTGAMALPATATAGSWDRHRALRVHLGVDAIVAGALVVVAAATGSGSWPFWPIAALAVALAVHAWVVLVGERGHRWRARRVTPALAVHAGVSAAVVAYLVAVWAWTGAGYFWPMWPLLGLAVPVAIHWSVVVSRRIDHLETARTDVVQVQETDLRRIERDLHDGAQARLVALGINLGMAEQKLDADPAAARALVTEARKGVGEALTELRDLVRGIRPPVLADRGLEAAIAALADRSPVPVGVVADVRPRPTDPVETAAYFVVAEALANAAKHAGASRVDVALVRRGDRLVVEVTDDGHGGANPSGSGLTGLRQRVEALDGRLTVTSPAGGPTIVRAELPCGS